MSKIKRKNIEELLKQKRKEKIQHKKLNIENTLKVPVIPNPHEPLNLLYKLIRDDMRVTDESESKEQDSDISEDEDDTSKKQTTNKKLQQKRNKRLGKREKARKRKSIVGRIQLCFSNHFGKIMTALIILSILFMAYIKISEETFGIQDTFEAVDYYKVMNVDRKATFSEIRRAYRKMAIKYHPDRNPNCKDCTQKMAELTDAYIILSNPETRSFHDRFGVRPPDSMVEIAKAKHGGRATTTRND